jgi:hypothetical protein
MGLYGKGFYIWKIPFCNGGDPATIARRAKEAKLSHVMIKIADGASWPYNFDFNRNVDLVPPVATALKEYGIQVWGWHYVRGYNPINEANLAIQRMRELDLDGYVIDAEIEYKKKGRDRAATTFMREIRAGLPRIPIALSTYRFPRTHPEFPYNEFLERCDYSMPQVYFEQSHNPVQQLERTVEQYMSLKHARPVIPTAPAYARGDWRPTIAEITDFFAKAKEMGLPGANAWSWDFASRDKFLDLWNAVADFDWDSGPPVADMPERLIGRMNQQDPVFISSLYAENAAHVTGERTVVGRQAVQDWYQILLKDVLPGGSFEVVGKTGSGRSRHFMWRATSEGGEVFDGNDTLSLIEDRIQYHYTYFSVT